MRNIVLRKFKAFFLYDLSELIFKILLDSIWLIIYVHNIVIRELNINHKLTRVLLASFSHFCIQHGGGILFYFAGQNVFFLTLGNFKKCLFVDFLESISIYFKSILSLIGSKATSSGFRIIGCNLKLFRRSKV
jgi:hypothetical protein